MLADLLVVQRPTAPWYLAPPPQGPRWRRIGPLVLKTLIIGYLLVSTTKACLARWREWSLIRARTEARYARTWKVDDFVRNSRPVPASPHDASRWRSVVFGTKGAVVATMDGRSFSVDYDAARQTFEMPSSEGKTSRGVLACARPDADHLVLTGTLASDSLIVTLHSLDPKRFFLVSRGFHWIDEAPEDR